MRSAIILLIFAFTNSGLAAQDKTVDTDQIVTGEKIYEYIKIVGDSSNTFGTIYERISRNPERDEISMTFVQELPRATLEDKIVVKNGSLKPVSYSSSVPDMQDITVNYDLPGNTVVNIKRNFPGQSVDTTFTVETDNPVFDYHWPHTLLYALQPLETKDDEINLPVFTYNQKKQYQTLSFSGNESVTLHAKKYSTVVWRSIDETYGAEHIYWIDSSSNRLLQSKTILPDGAIYWIRLKGVK